MMTRPKHGLLFTLDYEISHLVRGRHIVDAHGRCHSPVIAWLDMFFTHLSQVNVALADTGGFVQTVYADAVTFRATSALGDNTHGPQVGTGNTPVAMTNNKLETQIAHGNGAGQLYHEATQFIAPATSGPDRSFLVYRLLTNNSAGIIQIREIGLAGKGLPVGETQKNFLLERTVLDTPVSVSPGQSKQLRYTVRISLV